MLMKLDFYSNPDLEDGFNIWPHPWRSQPHRGLDFAKGTGTAIPSVNAGVVVISEWNPYLGNIVEVKGDDGTYIGYCHMDEPGLSVGTRVQVGDTIGQVGDTGSQSQGAHLHITRGDREGAVRGASISYLSDPWPYIQAAKSLPAIAEEGDDDMRPVYFKRTGQSRYLVIHPDIGRGLKPGETLKGRNVTTGLGYKTTTSPGIGGAWSKMYLRPSWFSVGTDEEFDALISEAQSSATMLAGS